MSTLDWIVLFGTLSFIVGYGIYKTRGSKNIEGYLLGDKNMRWWTIGLSVMATQASAITFLSTPGQAYEDGMRFVQFYFGLPLAMVVLSITVIPIYYKLKVYTAYEYLETRFDLKTRTLAAFIFLVQRGLATGITIYAPAIILSSLLKWDLILTNLLIGGLVILYTVVGGTKAVSQTQKQQMVVILGGMAVAFAMLINKLPTDVSFGDALHVAGKMGKLNAVDLSFDLGDRYNIWSGLLGGFFLALAYFGTDQSQVQRYLSGKSIAESRMGLIFNGLVKVPMQFMILLLGAMLFVFYQFYEPPVFFNQVETQKMYTSDYADEFICYENEHSMLFEEKEKAVRKLIDDRKLNGDASVEVNKVNLNEKYDDFKLVSADIKALIKEANPDAETRDTDYVFITFVMEHLPIGVVGLLFAVIFSAAMSSTSGELNALASTTTVDMYKRSVNKKGSDRHYLLSSKWFTVLWGALAIAFATYASLFENLIQAVNILGSIFYGTVLGIFLTAFYIKYVKSNAVFWAAVIAQITVIVLFTTTDIGYLWYNVIGCLLVVVISIFYQAMQPENN